MAVIQTERQFGDDAAPLQLAGNLCPEPRAPFRPRGQMIAGRKPVAFLAVAPAIREYEVGLWRLLGCVRQTKQGRRGFEVAAQDLAAHLRLLLSGKEKVLRRGGVQIV